MRIATLAVVATALAMAPFCITANVLAAVPSVGSLPLIGYWNGSGWSSQHSPLARGDLDGVSCTTVTACTAVGLAHGGQPLIERWNGTSWSLQHPGS